MSHQPVPLVLASRSPRRAELLAEAGVLLRICPSPFEDPAQPQKTPGVPVESVAMQLAFEKARALTQSWQPGAAAPDARCVVLAADSICVTDSGSLIGTPLTTGEAQAMLRSFSGQKHRVVTAVALIRWDPALPAEQPPKVIRLVDSACVHVGALSEAQITEHLQAGAWQGKAGGYNLFAVQAAGWLVRVEGDPTTVVGLPMRRLIPELQALGCLPAPAGSRRSTFRCRG